MPSDDREYIAALVRHAAETRALLSNAKKPERERMVVRAFLRCVGETFRDDEIALGQAEPIDVEFRSARFQIATILGGRRPGDDWREREKRYQAARGICDVVEPSVPSEPISFAEAAQAITEGLSKKARSYGAIECANLDALVYLDLGGRHLWPLSPALPAQTADETARQGWRSVSTLLSPYGAVLMAKPDAPRFLKNRVGQILSEWPQPDGLFDA